MGEISDSMISGECCQSCGVYLGEETGYPRHCSDCKPSKKKKKKKAVSVIVNKNTMAYYSLPERK